MSVSTLPTPVAPVKVSPIVSQAEILAAVAAGTMTVERAAPLLAELTRESTRPAPKVQARRTATGSVWLSLGYRAEKGVQNSLTLPVKGWRAVIALVKDGTVPDLIDNYDAIPLSSKAKGGAV